MQSLRLRDSYYLPESLIRDLQDLSNHWIRSSNSIPCISPRSYCSFPFHHSHPVYYICQSLYPCLCPCPCLGSYVCFFYPYPFLYLYFFLYRHFFLHLCLCPFACLYLLTFFRPRLRPGRVKITSPRPGRWRTGAAKTARNTR